MKTSGSCSSSLAPKSHWSKAHTVCVNCGTTRFKHAGHGYCTKCYSRIRIIEDVKKWTVQNPPEWLLRNRRIQVSADHLNTARRLKLEAAKQMLELYKLREEKLRSDSEIDVQTIAKQLQYLAILAAGHYIPMQKNVFWLLTESFSSEQKRSLYRILNGVIESLKLRGGRGIFTEREWTV